MQNDFLNKIIATHQQCPDCPTNEEVISIFERTIGLLFPQFNNVRLSSQQKIIAYADELKRDIEKILLNYPSLCEADRIQVSEDYFAFLPELKELLQKDVEAIYEEDPAAKSNREVIRCYPGFFAIAAHRLAHYLHKQQIEIIPRIISEYAHSKTGIDIHPGAQIGESFCIDHGTGVVIGETTVIGNHVKLYQGVTLGALSVDKKDANSKRHPTVEDRVLIYANTTILGGNTVIGEGSKIGGNVWIVESLPPNSVVYYVSEKNQIHR